MDGWMTTTKRRRVKRRQKGRGGAARLPRRDNVIMHKSLDGRRTRLSVCSSLGHPAERSVTLATSLRAGNLDDDELPSYG